jgi:hypothetical protein
MRVETNEEDSQEFSLQVTIADRRTIFTIRLFGIDELRILGRAVGNSSTVHSLYLSGPSEIRGMGDDAVNEGLLVAAAVRCFGTFFSEVKHNKSIVEAVIELDGVSMDDLSEFIQYNQDLKRLMLNSSEPVSLEQSTVLSRAIRSVQLEKMNIENCIFEDDGSLERVLEGCTRVNVLKMTCKYNSQCTAISALLRNPAYVLNGLEVDFFSRTNSSRLDAEQAVRDISTSLVENIFLRTLGIDGTRNFRHLIVFDSDKLLCDISSIESISNSNHTLECIDVFRNTLSTLTEQCLELNKNIDKAKVIRNKTLRFYFTGKFDVSPFVKMPLSVLPEVMGQIEGNGKQSAIFRLLQCMPEMCNASERKSLEQPGNKRQKITLVQNSAK